MKEIRPKYHLLKALFSRLCYHYEVWSFLFVMISGLNTKITNLYYVDLSFIEEDSLNLTAIIDSWAMEFKDSFSKYYCGFCADFI
jgi:hypothetical protein